MSEIDLGVSGKDRYDLPSDMSMGGDKTVYPTLHYCGPEELELPEDEEFTLTVRCRVKRETSSVEEDGSHWYECDIEVKKIVSVDGEAPETETEAPSRSYSEAGDALDKIAQGLMALKAHETEEGD